MYLTFYGLAMKPFNATPDPKFLYPSPAHRDALAQLLYATQERKGFMVLTGEVGTGKTTVLHAFRERLGPATAMSFVVNSSLSFDGILEFMLEDLGIAKGAETRSRRLLVLSDYLLERDRAGQTTVLVLDEAQNLDLLTLEQVRLLSNFETPNNKLLQIVLAGQPELKAKLQLPQLQQLKQRVELHCHISPLTLEHAREYIRTRLHVAGAPDPGLFTDAAVQRITDYARGVPRVISILCDHCLVFGYADQKRRIDPETVSQAIDYLEDRSSAPRQQRGFRGATTPRLVRWGLGTAVVAAAATVVTLAARFDTAARGLVHTLRRLLVP
jgi:general secretion pathway protein A